MNQWLISVKYVGYHVVINYPSSMPIVSYMTMMFLCCAKHLVMMFMLDW